MDHSLVTYSNLGSLVQSKKIMEITGKETLRELFMRESEDSID